MLVLLELLPTLSAAQSAQVLQVSTAGQNTVFFFDTAVPLDSVTCKVSNREAQVLRTGSISDGDAMVKTTVLIDISSSIPANMRDSVISAIDTLIEQKSSSDEYKLVTFGEKETVLCDFTADRYDLSKAAQNIVFDGNWSMIYDAVYNTIPDSSDQTPDVPVLCRTIVITDGVDLTKTGVTLEELFLKLQSSRYPVDVLSVSAAPDETPNKELSAITRISGGRYCNLSPDTELSSLDAALGVGSCSYLEVQVPEQLLDGSVRQVDLTIGADTLSLDVKFPAIYEQPEPEEPAPAVPPSGQEAAPAAPAPSFMEQYGMICAAAAALATLVLIAVLVMVLKGKKPKESEQKHNIDSTAGQRTRDGEETVPFTGEAQYTIKVSAPKHPGREWVLEIAGEVMIGRADHCDIVLEDKTVSREHCKIAAREEGLEAIHLGSNRTAINGVKVSGRCTLNSGDILSVGAEQLRIDYIQKLGSPATMVLESSGDPGRKTEPFF